MFPESISMKELREGITLLLERIGTAAVSFDISIGHICLRKRKKCWEISLTISRFFGRAHPNTNSGRIGGPYEAGYNIPLESLSAFPFIR